MPAARLSAGMRRRNYSGNRERPRLAGFRRLLAENVAGALGDAALHLALDDLVVDDGAGVVAGDVGDDARLASLRLDLDLRDVAAVRKGGADFRALLEIQVQLAGEFPGELGNADLAVGALDAVATGVELDVGLRALQRLGGEVDSLADDFLRS